MSNWISVEDRLPERTGEYLTWMTWGKITMLPFYIETQAWNVPWEDEASRKCEITGVSFWRELPEPPEVEK